MVTQRIRNMQLMITEGCVFELSPNKINSVRETCNHTFSKGFTMAAQILAEKVKQAHS